MVMSSFVTSLLVLALGIWALLKLEPTMNYVTERQLQIDPSRLSYKMWKDMPVTMYQSFTFFNLTNWSQVKSMGQKPRFVEVGPYVYRTVWSKSAVDFKDDDKLVTFAEKKVWRFIPHLSRGSEEDLIWTINTPLMTALALIQNAPVITRNIVSVILDGLGEGAFIKRNIKSLLFDGYSDLIVTVGPLFDKRFANFNGKFAYLYNKNDSIDGLWTVATGADDPANLNKIFKFQSNIVNMSNFKATNAPPQGLNEVKAECAAAWSLEQSTNGQLFGPFYDDNSNSQQVQTHHSHQHLHHQQQHQHQHQQKHTTASTHDTGKFIFYPDLCRPIHLLGGSDTAVKLPNGIAATRYYIDPRVFMNSTQMPTNKCYEMNPRQPLANALAATLANNNPMPNLISSSVVTSPFNALFNSGGGGAASASTSAASGPQAAAQSGAGLHNQAAADAPFERNSNHHSTGALGSLQPALAPVLNLGGVIHDQLASAASNARAPAVSRGLNRVRQLFTNIVSQRMSGNPNVGGYQSPSLLPAALFGGGHFPSLTARNSADDSFSAQGSNQMPATATPGVNVGHNAPSQAQQFSAGGGAANSQQLPQNQAPFFGQHQPNPTGSDRWITQFRFKWPRGVFSIGQCQLGAPIYASLPHFLDADEYYLEQVDGLKPNRSLHEFYIDIESTLHSVPVGAKARLQLNVATPELRFRNIPNAMIPVLWQEVTFELDKPVVALLYWSFTMSPYLYRLASFLLLAGGAIGLLVSLASICKLMARRSRRQVASLRKRLTPSSRRQDNKRRERQLQSADSQSAADSQSSVSWQMQPTSTEPLSSSSPSLSLSACQSNSNLIDSNQISASHSPFSSLDKLRQFHHHHHQLGKGIVNLAFTSCTDFCEPNAKRQLQQQQTAPTVATAAAINDQCELVATSLGRTLTSTCSGCLLACLRHQQQNLNERQQHHVHSGTVVGHHHNHHQCAATSDNSLVRNSHGILEQTSKIDEENNNISNYQPNVKPDNNKFNFRQ